MVVPVVCVGVSLFPLNTYQHKPQTALRPSEPPPPRLPSLTVTWELEMHIIKQKSNTLGECPLPFPQLAFHSHPNTQGQGPRRTGLLLTRITMLRREQKHVQASERP